MIHWLENTAVQIHEQFYIAFWINLKDLSTIYQMRSNKSYIKFPVTYRKTDFHECNRCKIYSWRTETDVWKITSSYIQIIYMIEKKKYDNTCSIGWERIEVNLCARTELCNVLSNLSLIRNSPVETTTGIYNATESFKKNKSLLNFWHKQLTKRKRYFKRYLNKFLNCVTF